jgi:hypothetical protein
MSVFQMTVFMYAMYAMMYAMMVIIMNIIMIIINLKKVLSNVNLTFCEMVCSNKNCNSVYFTGSSHYNIEIYGKDLI